MLRHSVQMKMRAPPALNGWKAVQRRCVEMENVKMILLHHQHQQHHLSLEAVRGTKQYHWRYLQIFPALLSGMESSCVDVQQTRVLLSYLASCVNEK